MDELALEWTMQIRKSIHKYEHHPAWKPFITIWLGLLGLAATIAQPGDVTERPVKKLSEASRNLFSNRLFCETKIKLVGT